MENVTTLNKSPLNHQIRECFGMIPRQQNISVDEKLEEAKWLLGEVTKLLFVRISRHLITECHRLHGNRNSDSLTHLRNRIKLITDGDRQYLDCSFSTHCENDEGEINKWNIQFQINDNTDYQLIRELPGKDILTHFKERISLTFVHAVEHIITQLDQFIKIDKKLENVCFSNDIDPSLLVDKVISEYFFILGFLPNIQHYIDKVEKGRGKELHLDPHHDEIGTYYVGYQHLCQLECRFIKGQFQLEIKLPDEKIPNLITCHLDYVIPEYFYKSVVDYLYGLRHRNVKLQMLEATSKMYTREVAWYHYSSTQNNKNKE